MAIDIDSAIRQVRTLANERIRTETVNGEISTSDSQFTDSELKEMMQRVFDNIYATIIERVPTFFHETFTLKPTDLQLDEVKQLFYTEIEDLWKIVNVYVTYSQARLIRMKPANLSEILNRNYGTYYYDNYRNLPESYLYYCLQAQRLYLPNTGNNGSFQVQYNKYSLSLDDINDLPSYMISYLVYATTCELKISSLELEVSAPVYKEKEKLKKMIEKKFLHSRNTNNPRRIRKATKFQY